MFHKSRLLWVLKGGKEEEEAEWRGETIVGGHVILYLVSEELQ